MEGMTDKHAVKVTIEGTIVVLTGSQESDEAGASEAALLAMLELLREMSWRYRSQNHYNIMNR